MKKIVIGEQEIKALVESAKQILCNNVIEDDSSIAIRRHEKKRKVYCSECKWYRDVKVGWLNRAKKEKMLSFFVKDYVLPGCTNSKAEEKAIEIWKSQPPYYACNEKIYRNRWEELKNKLKGWEEIKEEHIENVINDKNECEFFEVESKNGGNFG